MQYFNTQTSELFVLTTGVGFLMLLAGVHKSLLEWRNRRRHCPSCGRIVDGPVCRACTNAN